MTFYAEVLPWLPYVVRLLVFRHTKIYKVTTFVYSMCWTPWSTVTVSDRHVQDVMARTN